MVYEGVDDGFDQRERSSFSPLEFDPAATAAALERAAAFLGASETRRARTKSL